MICSALNPPLEVTSDHQARALSLKNNIWPRPADGSPVILNVAFFNGNEGLFDLVKETVKAWEKHANVVFQFLGIERLFDAHIRITFNGPRVFQSLVGTDSVAPNEVRQPSMTLGFTNDVLQDEPQTKGLILHEFGHALGLMHEHQNPDRKIRFLPDIFEYMRLTQGWDPNMVQQQIIEPANRALLTNSEAFDGDSVMLYFFQEFVTVSGRTFHIVQPSTKQNLVLSDGDIRTISDLYPKKGQKTGVVDSPGETTLEGFPLEIGKPKRGSIALAGREITYHFTIDTPGDYELRTKTPPGLSEEAWVLSLFDEDMTFLKDGNANSPDEGLNAFIKQQFDRGTYFLKVRNRLVRRRGDYDVLVTKV
jgi:hypothetical protein